MSITDNAVSNEQPVTGFCHSAKHTSTEKGVVAELCEAFEASRLPLSLKLQFFARHVRRQDIARLLLRYEIFKQTLEVNGSVVECGVMAGGSLLSWSHISSILEPYNHTRRVIGFDTFAGFPSIDEKDTAAGTTEHMHTGALRTHDEMKPEIEQLVAIHDKNRPLGHIPKVELVEGDACVTIPRYVEQNPHLLISLLYLDFDIYAPTKTALETLYPRIVKGGIVAFDELNCPEFPGETTALLEMLDLREVRLRRSPIDPYISYFIKE